MDTLIYSILRITVMVLILRTVIRLFSYPRSKAFFFKRGKAEKEVEKEQVNDPDHSEQKAPAVEMVKDEIYQKEIPRRQAYILLDDNDQHHYFISWESRQKFLDTKKKRLSQEIV